MRRIDTAAAVVDHDVDDVARRDHLDVDVASSVRIPQGVVEQVPERTFAVARRELDFGIDRGQPRAQRDPACLGDHRERRNQVGEDVGDSRALELDFERARGDRVQLEQPVDQLGQPVRLQAQASVVRTYLVPSDGEVVGKRLGNRADPRQRRAQVVRHPRDELPPRVFQLSLACRASFELRLHRFELVGECREFLGRRCGEAGAQVALADLSRRGDQAVAVRTDLRAEEERDQQSDRPGRDEHDAERGNRRRRDHHDVGRGHRTRGDRADRCQGDDGALDPDRSPASRAQCDGSDKAGPDRRAARHRDQLDPRADGIVQRQREETGGEHADQRHDGGSLPAHGVNR